MNFIYLECAKTLVNFEPTFTFNGIPIFVDGCQASYRWKAEVYVRLPT